MLIACIAKGNLIFQQINEDNKALLKDAIWIDLLFPTRTEEKLLERSLGFDIPTREEMSEIELSSRFYKDKDAIFMTGAMIAQSETPDPKLEPVTFVITQKCLVTIRYIEPHSLKLFTTQLKKIDKDYYNVISLFIELLDATVDRLADILEMIGRRMDDFSKKIFRTDNKHPASKLDYQKMMQQIGSNGDLNTKVRESLITFSRLITFFSQNINSRIDNEGQLRLSTLSKDILALGDHANFLSSKITFLLEAILGMVSIEQNDIIKIFSVAAVMFLPPTLIASIYGMNFHFLPELSWKYGYLFALGLMLLASWLPYKYFKSRKWL